MELFFPVRNNKELKGVHLRKEGWWHVAYYDTYIFVSKFQNLLKLFELGVRDLQSGLFFSSCNYNNIAYIPMMLVVYVVLINYLYQHSLSLPHWLSRKLKKLIV